MSATSIKGAVITIGTPRKKAKWRDVTHESYRRYTFPNGQVVHVDLPIQLAVVSYGHRIRTEDGRKFDVPFGWISLERGRYNPEAPKGTQYFGEEPEDSRGRKEDADTWNEGGGSKGDPTPASETAVGVGGTAKTEVTEQSTKDEEDIGRTTKPRRK